MTILRHDYVMMSSRNGIIIASFSNKSTFLENELAALCPISVLRMRSLCRGSWMDACVTHLPPRGAFVKKCVIFAAGSEPARLGSFAEVISEVTGLCSPSDAAAVVLGGAGVGSVLSRCCGVSSGSG